MIPHGAYDTTTERASTDQDWRARRVEARRRRLRAASGESSTMLTTAAIGMAGYGAFEAAAGVFDLIGRHRLEIVADLASLLFGTLLVLAAAFVRVRLPGGLALAIGALLALQALAIHHAAHVAGAVTLAPQLVRGGFAALLVALAHFGDDEQPRTP
jgi:hypothetical protein